MFLSSSFNRWLEAQGLTLPPPNTPSRALAQAWGGESSALLSRSTFSVARVLAALWVFLCHSFYSVHYYYGFLSVVVFFFISGYGMCLTGSRSRALVRLPRFIAVYFFFSVFYYLGHGSFHYPTSWFILVYSCLMVLFYFFGRSLLSFTLAFLSFVFFLFILDFHFNYLVCPFGFLYGVYVYRCPRISFSPYLALFLYCIFLFVLFFDRPFPFYPVFLIPFFVRLFFGFCSWSILYPLSRFALLVFPFFSLHCWFLTFFDSTWTMGLRGQSVSGAFLSFLLSFVGAFFLYRFVPIFSKKKFFIFK